MTDAHPSITDLIAVVRSEADGATRGRVLAHLQYCSRCAASFAELRSVDQGLANWHDPAPQTDRWSAIADRLTQIDRPQHTLRWQRTRKFARFAAALLLGVGFGHGLARLSGSPGASNPVTIGGDEALSALGVDQLLKPGAVGLAETVLRLETMAAAEGGAP